MTKFIIKYILLIISITNIVYAQRLEISSVNSNSSADDFAPVYYNNGLIIVSNKKNTFIDNYYEIDSKGNEVYLNDMYHYSFTKEGNRLKHEHDFHDLNESYLHDGPCTFSKNYDTIIFSRSSYQLKRKEKTKIGLYQSVKTNGKWNTPIPLTINSTDYNLSHPFWDPISKDLYFVSDKSGGLGKMDIWKTTRINDSIWSTPENLGSTINSKADEIFPYKNKEGIFYFSSNRSQSLGGFDIFYIESINPTQVNHFKNGINSTFDDYALITNDNGKSGYFTSNRKNKQDDIYFFDHIINTENCIESYEPKFCFTFYDTEKYRNGKHIKYVWNFGDDSVSHKPQPNHCYATTGIKHITMDLYDTITGVDSKNVGIFDLEIKEPLKNYIKSISSTNNSLMLNVTNYETQKNTNQEIIWLHDDTYVVNKDLLILESDYPSEFEVTAFLEKDSCLHNRFYIYNEKTPWKKIKIVPNHLKNKVLSIFVEDLLREYLKTHQSNTIALQIPKVKYNQQIQWTEELSAYLSSEFNLALSINYESNSNHTLLIFP